ncbi:MAG: AvaI/BsoBI family type II restriction endonuclease [Methanoregula sp.]
MGNGTIQYRQIDYVIFSRILTRIRRSFSLSGHTPASFFIGAAIQHRMAEELWMELEAGTLSNAANFTNRAHLASLCGWLCAL